MNNSFTALTLVDIATVEPRINNVLYRAKHDRRRNRAAVYSEYKAELSQLVGWGAEDEALRTDKAYETVIIALCRVLKI